MLAWAYRIASRRGLGSPLLRGLATVLALPVLAAAFSLVEMAAAGRDAWPTGAGLGGACGHLVANFALGLVHSLGSAGVGVAALGACLLAVLLVALSLGLSPAEWRGRQRGRRRPRRASAP